MRDILISIWRKLTQIKICTPLICVIRYIAGTNVFNTVLDFIEVYVCHTSYEESRRYYSANLNRIKAITLWLEDEKSKRTYLNIWKYRVTHKRKYLRGIVSKDQYFSQEVISFGPREYFIDGGAYKGDIVKRFMEMIGGAKSATYGHIYAFEPDIFNFTKLKYYVSKRLRMPGNKIDIFNMGLWENPAILTFKGNIEEACMISVDGNSRIPVDSIDNIIGDRKITFIKMDIEGAELSAIKGARKTIEHWKPKMAVCIYHTDKDMIEIVEYIRKNYPFYKIYIRHYSWFYADTVLYAVQ